MVAKNRKIIWPKLATRQFNEAIKYILKQSVQNAENVKTEILHKVETLKNSGIVHREDPYKKTMMAITCILNY